MKRIYYLGNKESLPITVKPKHRPINEDLQKLQNPQ